MLCDIKRARETFKEFKQWHKEKHPKFKGVIRWSAEDIWIADIIDENQNLRKYRFGR